MDATITSQSLLDNDFYKFTMQHAVIKLFPKAKQSIGLSIEEDTFSNRVCRALRASVDAMAGNKT
jgi:nicotinate phosphoribosyltransferase